MIGSAVKFFYLIKKAAVAAGVAGCACLDDLYKQGIIIAVAVNRNDFLKMTARCALIPKLLPASGPEPGITRFKRFFKGFPVHIRKHQHFAGAVLLNNSRYQIGFFKILFNLHFHTPPAPLSN